MARVVEQEASVLVLLGLSLRLTQRVEADAGDDQDRGATERQVRVQVERHDEHGRQQRHEEQVDGANGVQAVDDVLQVACGGVAGADARDEAAVLLHVVRRLIGVERDLGVEEREEHDHEGVQADVPHGRGVGQIRVDPLHPAGFGVAELRDQRGDRQD